MFATLSRVLFGFVIACLIVGVVQAGFVMTPMELYALPDNVRSDRISDAGVLSLVAATQSAVFAAPFALVAAAVAEWQGIRSLFFYAFMGFAIAAGGFAALYAAEVSTQSTIFNSYGMAAYALPGLAGGFVDWLLSGRFAGDEIDDEDVPPAMTPPPPVAKVTRPAAAVPPARPKPTPAAPPPSPSIIGIPPKKA